MAEISLTLICGADEHVTVRLDLGSGPMTVDAPGPSHELVSDLLGQLRLVRMANAAARHLSEILGRVLFAGAPGEALRVALRDDAEPVVLLATDPRLAEWPWELARDPETGLALVLEAAMLVRESGAPAERATGSRRAVLVVPGEQAVAHAGTLQAATRTLGRKLGVDVFPLEPATGPTLRRWLARGALLVHIETTVHGDALTLDDGHVPVERIGLDSDTWLVVLGGTDVTLPLHGRLRALGVPLVLGLQLSLEPAAAAALDREFYRALAGGESVGESVRRARRALIRFGGLEGHAWAAPVLWAAPAVHGRESPAVMPFPPAEAEQRRDPGATLVEFQAIRVGAPPAAGVSPLRSRAETVVHAPIQLPFSAPGFVQETIRCMREGRQEPDLPARIEALRLLGGTAVLGEQDAELNDLSPFERTTRLADRLVATISRPDAELSAPVDFETRLGVASRAVGLSIGHLRLMAQALLAGRGLVLSGGDLSLRRRVARTLAEDVYDTAVLTARTDVPDRFIGGPAETGFGGWLYEAVAMNWRRDELDPYRIDGVGPTQRVPVVARAIGGHFRILRGVWAIAESGGPELRPALRDLLGGLGDGALVGVSAGRLFRLAVPADFRLLLCVEDDTPLLALLPSDMPVFSVCERAGVDEADDVAQRERWLSNAEARFGHAEDVAESQARLRMAELISHARAVLEPARPLSASHYASAMALALQLSGTPEVRVDRALAVHLAPHLAHDLEPGLLEPWPCVRAALRPRR